MRDNVNKFKSREYEWHPRRSWKRRYLQDLKKLFYSE